MNARAHCAAAVSTLADTRAAAEDVAARVRDGLAGAPADLAFLFLSPEHVTDAEDAAAAVASVLEPGALAGSTGEAVIGTARELEGVPAMSLLATSLPGGRASVYHLTVRAEGFAPWNNLVDVRSVPEFVGEIIAASPAIGAPGRRGCLVVQLCF